MRNKALKMLSLASLFALATQPVMAFNYPLTPHALYLEGAVNLSHLDYHEESHGVKNFAEDKGWFYGPQFAVTYVSPSHFTGKLEVKVARGRVDYQGYHSGTSSGTRNDLLETRGLIGYQTQQNTQHPFAVYTGFGYRYLKDNSAGTVTSVGTSGYDRKANYYYTPVGVTARILQRNYWYVDGNIEYDYLWHGLQHTDLTIFDGAEYFKNKQDNGHALRGFIRFSHPYSNGTLAIKPFITYWRVDASERLHGMAPCGSSIQMCILEEPQNDTFEYGIQVGYTIGNTAYHQSN